LATEKSSPRGRLSRRGLLAGTAAVGVAGGLAIVGRPLLAGAATTSSGLWVGAFVPGSTSDFAAASSTIGPLRVRRSFNSLGDFPATFAQSAAASDPGTTLSFLSTKAPVAEVIAGDWDDRIRALALSWPASHLPGWWTMWHEPENDMSASDFVAMFRRFYSVAKEANSALRIGYVAMAYQWLPTSTTTTTPDAWYPGDAYTDFLGVDVYNVANPALHPERWATLATQKDFQRWYAWAAGKNKWLHVVEYGCKSDPADASHRAATLQAGQEWLTSTGKFRMYLYWDGSGSDGDWALTDQPSIDAWKSIAANASVPK
jgi:hypothetical protein